MRLRILLLGAVVAVAIVAAPAAPAAGGRNPQTAGLQVALRAQGLYRGPIDAIAGPATVAAVRDFQRAEGLPVTGLADGRTREALGPLGRPLFGARTLHRGAFGWDVAVLQFLLVRQGISVPINAYYDGPTLHGVQVMQQRLHLRRDGVVGPHTFAALIRREPVPLARPIAVKVRTTRHHHHARRVLTAGHHVVHAGESLTSIARRYHTTVARLARMNHLDPAHVLLIGTRLRVPRARHGHVAPRTTRVAYRTQSVASVRSLLDRWAAHYGVSIHLVRALAWMESGYNNHLVSNVGARGIMQLLPSTFHFAESVLIGHHLRHDASGNVRAGVAYLAHLLHDFHGNTRLALAAWYQGERAVRKHGLYKVSKTFVTDVLALAQRM
ncbi:MAG TPA: peptidoglycan-binding protein [Gaiellaceae bacterium]|nr:peptidoglycan-binding protein [Gaiellaceae bacterium]